MINIGKLKRLFMPLLLCLLILYIIVWFVNIFVYIKPQIQYTANNTYEETLVVVAKENFAPYSFIDESGELSGYNIELVNLIANELQMNVDIQLLSREECIDKIISGEADLVCNANYSSEFEEICLLSAPTGKHRVVIYGLQDYETFHKLYDKKIARIVDSPVESTLHMQLGFTHITEFYSHTDAFEAVMTGQVDYVIGPYSILNYMTHATGYTELEVVNAVINTEAFAFGISNNNVELQQRVNDALTVLDNTTLYESISDKWLGSYIKSTTVDESVKESLPAVLALYTIILFFIYYFIGRPLHRKTQRDKATKLYDKVTTQKLIERKLSAPGTLMVIDINKFKAVNDTYGHAIGDTVINAVAESLRMHTRSGDIVGRIGGDEFIVYLPSMQFHIDAIHKAEAFRQEVLQFQNTEGIAADISIGIAFHTPPGNYDTLFIKADKALYEAKHTQEHIAVFSKN